MSEISRRKFIQLTVLGSAVTATGCKIEPKSRYDARIYRAEAAGQYGGYDNRALPYVNQPDGFQDGVPQYFATACQMCPAGCGLFVRTIGGRATQVQGNPDHPVSGGKICSRGVASLQHLYHPDRLRFPQVRMVHGTMERTNWESALTQTTDALRSAGSRSALLIDALTFEWQPTLSRLIGQFAAVTGAAVYSYALHDDAPWRAATQAVYGKNQLPAYQLDEADCLLAFGSDFLEAGPSQVYYNRLFGEFRQGPRRTQGTHGTFLYIGPRMNATAAKADFWLPCNPGTEALVAQHIAARIRNAQASVTEIAAISGLSAEQLSDVVMRFQKAGTRAVAIGGCGILSQPNATLAMTAIESLNALVKSQCVSFGQAALPMAPPAQSYHRQIQTLTNAIQSGHIKALLILGQPNPVFTLPANLNFDITKRYVPFVAALTPFEDETSAFADMLLPTRTFLEDWGDNLPAVVPAGATVATLRQPIIDPQYITDAPGLAPENFAPDLVPWMDTRPVGDLLIDMARRLGKPLPATDMHDAVRHTWSALGQADLAASGTNEDRAWVQALANGGYWKQGATSPAVGRNVARPPIPSPSALAAGTFALHLFTHPYWWDGRHANLPWMQEHPDPMTSAVWNAWVEINMEVAQRMEIRTGDIIRISSPYGSVEAPAVPFPGLHPQVVAMPLGQGHTAYGRYANERGVNPLAILAPTADTQTGAFAYGATQVRIEKVQSAKSGYQGNETLVLTQDRPGGPEPEAVQDLIHTTAREWKRAQPVHGPAQAEGSIFHRQGTIQNPGADNPGE